MWTNCGKFFLRLANITRVTVALISAVDPYPTDAGKKVVLAGGFIDYLTERHGQDNVHYIKKVGGVAPQQQFPVRVHVVPGPSRREVLGNLMTRVSTGRASLQEAFFLGSPQTAAGIATYSSGSALTCRSMTQSEWLSTRRIR